MLNITEILPQKYPFLMIDQIIDFKKDEYLTAVKNITGGEWCFQGQTHQSAHFPETLLIEVASQAALMLYQKSKIKEGERRPEYILGKITSIFSEFAHIGDQIFINALANKMLDTGGYSEITLSKDSSNIAQIEIIYSVQRGKE